MPAREGTVARATILTHAGQVDDAIKLDIGVIIVAKSLLDGSVTHFRTFALGLGLLAPALIWAALHYFVT